MRGCIYSERNGIKKKLGERADRRPFLHNGGPIVRPFSATRADTSAIWGREGGGARQPLFHNDGAMGGPPL